ncbi:magnesium transporter CorA family protein [Anaeromicropila herbilytica]|uniref:Magnesium transporter n=1 Tax=Anaeromicropila herbilytica TaxID=2785025 RepID=A0A7R7ID41_9FIRM|nr:magnesium transporter CorA family protein [Anaeromicropila herbilytica]BCN31177.1 magnesium transporter [Anaeromicropila herbilytica]
MITIYKTIDNKLVELSNIEKDCYISIVHPTEEELFHISNEYHIDIEDLSVSLNTDGISSYFREKEYTVISIYIPKTDDIDGKVNFTTIPLSIIFTDNHVFTICLEDTFIEYNLSYGRFKNIYTYMKYRFILQILYRHTSLYLEYLNIIEKRSKEVEKNIKGITKNSQLSKIYELNKMLLYFKTSLLSNHTVYETLLEDERFTNEKDIKRLLMEVIVRNKHAIDITNIYQEVLEDMIEMISSMISNNLNTIMKFLSMVTIVISIPNMVSGFYGMNINRNSVPFAYDDNSFIKIVLLAAILSTLIAFLLQKKDYFKKD